MKKILSWYKKIFFIWLLLFINIITIFSLDKKSELEKGDIYSPQENSIGDIGTIIVNNGLKETDDGYIEVKKIVSKVKNSELNEYTVEFKIRGNDTNVGIETVKPVYVVIVLDASNSMDKPKKWENAKEAVEEFTTELLKKIPTAKIALIKFAGRSINDNFSDAEVVRFFENKKIEATSIGDVKVNGGGATNLGEGLRQAYRLLNNQKIPSDNSNIYDEKNYIDIEKDSTKYVVVLSDGVPTLYTDENGKSINSKESNYATRYCAIAYNSALNWANKLKADLNSKIITIGYELDKIEWTKDRNKAYELLNEIATNSDFVMSNTAISNVIDSVKQLTSKLTIKYNAGLDVVINDKLGNNFTISSGSNILKLDKITTNWTSLGSFNIKLDKDSKEGWHPTNDGFKVIYKDFNGILKEINCNINPLVYWEEDEYQYTINYYFNNILDSSYKYTSMSKLNSTIYSKDNYLTVEMLSKKNNEDSKNYFLGPNNNSSIIISENEEKNYLNIYYISTELNNESINKDSDIETITNHNTLIKYKIDYKVKINNVNKGDKLNTIITDYLPYPIDIEKSNLNGGIYDEENNTITFIYEEVIEKYKSSYDEIKNIEYLVVYKNIVNGKPLVNTVNAYSSVNNISSKGVSANDEINVNILGNVCAIYVEENNHENKLSEDICLKGLVGSNYETNSKEILGYTMVEEPVNNKGNYDNKDIIVKYIYRKNKGIINHTIEKVGNSNVNNINDYFNYKVNISSQIREYVGNIKLVVIDYLPYKIDIEKSILDDRCELSNENKITCLIDYEYQNKEAYNINEVFKFKLLFIDITDAHITNTAESYIVLDNNIDKKQSTFITNIPYGYVTVNYVDKNNNVLAPNKKISKLVGAKYKTERLVIDDYFLVDIIGSEEGEITNNSKNITYIYDKTPNPPHTGIKKQNNIKYIFLLIFPILLIVIKNVFKVKKKISNSNL